MPQSRHPNAAAIATILDLAAIETVALKELAGQLVDEVRLASAKARAHLSDPRAFPMPADRGALECVLVGDATFAQGLVIAATTRNLNQIDLFMRGFDGNIWSHAWDWEWKSFVV